LEAGLEVHVAIICTLFVAFAAAVVVVELAVGWDGGAHQAPAVE